MSRMNRQGFTLIELMVVIVIIGVLASLAIPKFSEASSKAKMAEAPRILASFESAYATTLAEMGTVTGGREALIFEIPQNSKWFNYNIMKDPTTEAGPTGDPRICVAKAANNMGAFKEESALWTGHVGNASFKKVVTGGGGATDAEALAAAKKLVPNFQASGSDTNFGECGATDEWGISKPATANDPAEYGCIPKA